MDILQKQVGGDHYRNMAMQPCELFAKTKCTPFQANIWKYISRYKNKNGKEDLEKCIHYAELAHRFSCQGFLNFNHIQEVRRFCKVNNLSEAQTAIIVDAALDNYIEVIAACRLLISVEYEI